MTNSEIKAAEALCSDCPRVGYPTDETRCAPCPRRAAEAMREAAAMATYRALEKDLLWSYCDRVVKTIRALPLPEPAPDPREQPHRGDIALYNDDNGVVLSGRWAGWLVWRHPDQQWVTVKEPRIEHALPRPAARDPRDETIRKFIEALAFADNQMTCIVENDPNECIADGGITVWHGVGRDARRWIANYRQLWQDAAKASIDQLSAPDPRDEALEKALQERDAAVGGAQASAELFETWRKRVEDVEAEKQLAIYNYEAQRRNTTAFAKEATQMREALAKAREALVIFDRLFASTRLAADELQPDLYEFEDSDEVDFDMVDFSPPENPLLWGDIRCAHKALAAINQAIGE